MRGNAFMNALLKVKQVNQGHPLPVVTGGDETGETDVSSSDLLEVTEVSPGVADEDLDIASYLDVPKSVPVEKKVYAELIQSVRELEYEIRMARIDNPDPRLAEVLTGLDLIEQLLS